ncbi:4519_t:CDS:2 [Racocetra persica]|uniref:4519_t:CDS:1 n=1 Tax=Racocetra persica TaxID=160502 RepID=A0ACA9LFM5_9GLOM|nr:4519_t:CDS:2 [Racocetra persica]
MPEASESNEYREEEGSQEESRPENELEDVISEVDDIDMLVEDLSIENNPEVQELISNIKKYTHLIDQPVMIEDALTDKRIIEMINYESIRKIIKFQESLKVRKGFDKKELKVLRKQFKEWYYEREKNKKHLSILSFLGLND